MNKFAFILYIAVNMASKLPEITYERVCALYGVPVLSFRGGVHDEVVACATHNITSPAFHGGRYCRFISYYNASTFWMGLMGDPHPGEETHRLVAQAVAYYFMRIIEIIHNATQPDLKLKDQPSAPVFSRHLFSISST